MLKKDCPRIMGHLNHFYQLELIICDKNSNFGIKLGKINASTVIPLLCHYIILDSNSYVYDK